MSKKRSGQLNSRKHPSVQILVATHKRYRMPQDPIYLPIQLGAAIDRTDENGKALDLGYVKDNEGDNISSRNPSFCELTGLYWAWKHIDADYIGLVHYRRHFRGNGHTHRSGIRKDIFDKVLTGEELEPLLSRYKIFVPRKRYYFIETLWSHYEHSHYIEHLEKTRAILKEKYPAYVDSFDEVMHERSGHMFNMLIMRREELDAYCTWLFDILFALERQVDVRNYSYFQGRYCGRVGELILNVWLRYQEKNGNVKRSEVKVLPYLYTERVNWLKKGNQFLRAKFLHEKYENQ